jgi:hypothetical protein
MESAGMKMPARLKLSLKSAGFKHPSANIRIKPHMEIVFAWLFHRSKKDRHTPGNGFASILKQYIQMHADVFFYPGKLAKAPYPLISTAVILSKT